MTAGVLWPRGAPSILAVYPWTPAANPGVKLPIEEGWTEAHVAVRSQRRFDPLVHLVLVRAPAIVGTALPVSGAR